jgi:hypothetical protein
MLTANHHENPELWFRPSPVLPFKDLLTFLDSGEITATPRLGKRDESHPKGYVPGTLATVRLFDERERQRLSRRVRIESVASKPLRDFAAADLEHIVYSADWRVVQQVLSFFEGRPVAPDEVVSIVEFSYLNHTDNL